MPITYLDQPKITYIDEQSKESISTKGLGYIKEHPYKTILEPAAKTLTGKTIAERIDNSVGGAAPFAQNFDMYGDNPIAKGDAFIRSYTMGLTGDVLDMMSSPINIIGGKVISTAGKIAKPVLNKVGSLLMNDLMRATKSSFKYGANPGRAVVKLVPASNSMDDLAVNVSKVKDEIGSKISTLIESNPKAIIPIDITDSLKPIDDAISTANKTPNINEALVKRLIQIRTDLLNKFDDAGNVIAPENLSNITAKEAFNFKDKINSLTKWTGNVSDDKLINSALQDSYRNVRDKLNTAIPELKPLNRDYGDLAQASNLLKNKEYYQQARFQGTPLDIISGILGYSVGNAPGAAVAVAVERGLSAAWKSPAIRTRLAKFLYTATPEVKEAVIKEFPQVAKFATNYASKLSMAGKAGVDKAIKPDVMPKKLLELPKPKSKVKLLTNEASGEPIKMENPVKKIGFDSGMPKGAKKFGPENKAEYKGGYGQFTVENGKFKRTNLKNNKGFVENTGKANDFKKNYSIKTEVDDDGLKTINIFGKNKDVSATLNAVPDEKNAIYVDWIESHEKGAGRELIKHLQNKYDKIYMNAVSESGAKMAKDTGFKMTQKPDAANVMSAAKYGGFEWTKKAVKAAAVATTLSSTNSAEASTLGEKNNNPINLKAFDKWDGMTGKDKQGHAIFKDLDHGIRASIKNLNNHKNKNPEQTLSKYLSTFAEANSKEEADFIAKNMNINVNTKLKDIDMDEMLIHLAKFESKINLKKEDIDIVRKKFNLNKAKYIYDGKTFKKVKGK